MGWTGASGVHSHYDVAGAGSRSLILAHELGGSIASWDMVMPWLTTEFRVLRWDQRGAGLSEKPRTPFTIEDHARDLAVVVEAAELKPPYHLAGVAAGVAIMLAFASLRPRDIAAAVFCAPAIGANPQQRDYLEGRSAKAVEQGMGAIVDSSLARSYPDVVIRDRAQYEIYRARFLANDPVGYAFANRALAAANLDAAIEQWNRPCLVLAGAHDLLRSPSDVEAFARRLPKAEFEILDTGHLMPVQAPTAVGQRMRDFFLQQAS